MDRIPTIFVVDNDFDFLEAITLLAKPLGANIETFTRTDDFLRRFHHDGPACLILEVRMAGMSGLELQAKLTESGCRLPIILVTGHADVRMAVDAMKAGAMYFFEKPYRSQELFDAIQQSLRTEMEFWQRHDEEQSVDQKLSLLTSREREVIDLIKQRKTNEEIARELHLSVRGVEARRAKAMKILRVDSKAELKQLLRTTGEIKTKQEPLEPNAPSPLPG